MLLRAHCAKEAIVVAAAEGHRAFAAGGGVGSMVALMGLHQHQLGRGLWDDTKVGDDLEAGVHSFGTVF
jgi:hypothetical protein